MDWQAVFDFEDPSLDQLSQQLRERGVAADVIKRISAALTAHVVRAHFQAAVPCVKVLTSGADLMEARNFFVVETGAVSQPCLEVYVY
jgi:hypothetical protein